MKTLVIHMDDRTTDFLKDIYKDTDWTVITNHVHHTRLISLIKEHERIVMLGHGSPGGLFGDRGGYIIHAGFVPLLKDKECVCIWCNADQFVEKYGLQGLYSGMFISEVMEASIFRIFASPSQIIRSNELFASILKKHIFNENAAEKVKEEYVITNDPVVEFNNERIYQTKPRQFLINIIMKYGDDGLVETTSKITKEVLNPKKLKGN